MKISIIIPSFNQGKFIEQAILSIIKQDYLNKEIIVIDGGSTDETTTILEKYDKEISYWVSEPDNGQAHAINKGFAKATGDILGWMNSDDYYLPGYLSIVVKKFYEDDYLDAVYANSITIDERDNSSYPEYGKYLIDKFLIYGGVIYSHTTFWRSRIHQNIDEQIICALDYELWLRLFPGKKYQHINYFGAVFRMQLQSKSMQGDKSFKEDWEKDYRYIENKHHLAKPSIWLHRYFRLVNFFYQTYCRMKYAKEDLSKLR